MRSSSTWEAGRVRTRSTSRWRRWRGLRSKMSRGFIIALAVLLPSVAAVVAWWPWSPGGRQFINMRIAEHNLGAIQAVIDSDSRYSEVRAIVYTGSDGAIGIVGSVKNDEDLCELMKNVAKKKV